MCAFVAGGANAFNAMHRFPFISLVAGCSCVACVCAAIASPDLPWPHSHLDSSLVAQDCCFLALSPMHSSSVAVTPCYLCRASAAFETPQSLWKRQMVELGWLGGGGWAGVRFVYIIIDIFII